LTEIFREELVQRITKNLLDVQILRLVQTKSMWGYKIKKEVESLFNVKLRHSSLYPLLKKLEQNGFLTSKQEKRGGRIRKVYTITRKGTQYLQEYKNILKEQIQKQDIIRG